MPNSNYLEGTDFTPAEAIAFDAALQDLMQVLPKRYRLAIALTARVMPPQPAKPKLSVVPKSG